MIHKDSSAVGGHAGLTCTFEINLMESISTVQIKECTLCIDKIIDGKELMFFAKFLF